jgi:DNA-binding XRE family transcriptional regulator
MDNMMKTAAPHDSLPVPVRRALRKLGEDMRDARRRRRIPTPILAQRAGISRTTLTKIEAGEPGVGMASYGSVLFVLGLIDRLSELADLRYDTVGQQLEEEALPKRIRLSRRKPPEGSP